jgi:mono/diheme cytochrome c family protein
MIARGTYFGVFAITLVTSGIAGPAAAANRLASDFTATVQPFLRQHCLACHGGEKTKGDLDLTSSLTLPADAALADLPRWTLVLEKLTRGEMPPPKAAQPPPAQRQKVTTWIAALRAQEARKNAGDPGVVLARRLSNAEYNYTIRDLTGVDLRPAREFPVDPSNPAGFDNSGESLAMSPALLNKYLQAARDVANHLVVGVQGLAFAPHLVLADTDRDRYTVGQIVDFYRQQDTDYAHYFAAAWAFKHRAQLGQPRATLPEIAQVQSGNARLSPRYLATVWQTLNQPGETVGPIAKLQTLWRALPGPAASHGSAPPAAVVTGCAAMRDFVVQLRKKIEPRFAPLTADGIRGTAQPFLMWKNQQYASHRMTFDPAVLQVEGETPAPLVALATPPKKKKSTSANADDDGEDGESAPPVRSAAADPDLHVPAGQRETYAAAFARFAAVFPDAFYIAERGRNYLDPTKERGRLLSAGFHNLMGYFRDDQPLGQLILDDAGRKQLDRLWQDLDFVAAATERTFTQFYLSESGEARDAKGGARAEGGAITAAATVNKVAAGYLTRARSSGNPVAIQAVERHFAAVNDSLRWVERARIDAQPRHLDDLLAFAARAYRRPLSAAERDDLLAYYRGLRATGPGKPGLDHEAALRDVVVSVLMSPDFCYRIDLAPGEVAGTAPLSDHALASRLAYFLWSSMPDTELLEHAAAGDLHQPAVLIAQARRMLKDQRALGLATEFGGNWLDFRRFEQHNAVDRERFASFDDQLRAAMFEEPIRFLDDVIHNDRSLLDLLYAKHTFVNAVLARHYGMTGVAALAKAGADQWVKVDDASRFGRGGILPMGVFLTMNAPGLRTSPVKRGYWLVRRVLGEQIPPPPAVVPELPRDEAKLELPLRDMLARHRADPSCASCHARFDAFGLAFEGYGPIGEVRSKDLAGRPVDTRATFPGGAEAVGVDGIRRYIRARRQDDFVDNLCRKLLVYGLGRSLLLSDEPLLTTMKTRLRARDYHVSTLIEQIVSSPQFRTQRGRDVQAQNSLPAQEAQR